MSTSNLERENLLNGGQSQNPNPNPNGYNPINPRAALRRARTTSVENTSLTEVITIYEKLKKRRDRDIEADVFKLSTNYGFEFHSAEDSEYEETLPLEPFNFTPNLTPASSPQPSPPPPRGPFQRWTAQSSYGSFDSLGGTQKVLDFNKYKNMPSTKYLYFSSASGLVQANSLDQLKYHDTVKGPMNYIKLLQSKQYWLNIVDPSEKDLALLSSAFNVHDLTLRDIKEGNTEEKIEVYKHYMFMSLRLLSESSVSYGRGSSSHMDNNDNDGSPLLSVPIPVVEVVEDTDPRPVEDVDFNILLFSNFIITIHDKYWGSIKDVLGFLNLLTTHGSSTLTPDWVVFSIFIELAQDAKFSMSYMEPKILDVKISGEGKGKELSAIELSKVLRTNYEYDFEICKIARFVKPKMNILKVLKFKCNKRLNSPVVKLLSNLCSEFEEFLEDLHNYSRTLERSQDTFIAMANIQQTIEANAMGRVMKRISEIALIFLPVQAVGGFMGMNCKVPFQSEETTFPFWGIVGASVLVSVVLYLLRSFILGRRARHLLDNL